MNIYKKTLLFFPLPSPRPLPHRPHARPPRPFRHTAGEAGAPPPSHRRRAAGAHPSSPPHRAGPPRSLSSTAHSSSLPCSVPCAERRRGLAPSSSSLSHDGGVRIWLCSATRCHPPPPHPAPTRRIRAGGGSTRRERRPARGRGVQRRPVVGGSGPAAGGAASVCSGGRRWPRGRPARRPARLGRKRLPANGTAAAALQDGGEGVARRRLGGRTVSVRRSGRRAGPRGTCGGALRDGGERGRGGPAGWRRGSGAAAALQDGD